MMGDIYDELAAAWPAPIVARREVGKFSGGVLNPRTMANLDCLGLGVPGKFQCGPRQVAYDWMRERGKKTKKGGK